MHNLTVGKIIFGVSVWAAVIHGVLAWPSWQGEGLPGGQGNSAAWPTAPDPGCPAARGAPCALWTHTSTFSSREKGLGQARWVLLILLWSWGVLRSACSGPTFYTDPQKSTGRCVPSHPCHPFPLKSSFPRQQKLGASCSCNCFFPSPSLLLCWPLQGINGDRAGEGSPPPWLSPSHTPNRRVCSTSVPPPAPDRSEALAQLGTAREVSWRLALFSQECLVFFTFWKSTWCIKWEF